MVRKCNREVGHPTSFFNEKSGTEVALKNKKTLIYKV